MTAREEGPPSCVQFSSSVTYVSNSCDSFAARIAAGCLSAFGPWATLSVIAASILAELSPEEV